MKKALAFLAAGLVAISATAATANELRVYINPGHGSYTPNDRPMAIKGHGPYQRVNTDTTSFFESNTNLRKGFGILEKLRAMGLQYNPELNQTGERWQIGAARDLSNNIVMSHVKCGPYHDDNGTANQFTAEGKTPYADLEYYNRSLTEIDMEVDANNFDMFISIHSNALDSSGQWKTTNFPIILYRGYDDCHGETGVDSNHSLTSKEMAQKVWPYHMQNIHECWTYYSATNMNIRGDINFYGSNSTARGYKGYLGVLKHGVPGFLIEGYFHQYAPAALRHMNWDVDYVEGFNYAHGIADYFGIQKESTGDVYGIVRDAHERYRDNDYVPVPTHNDAFKPLDNATVTLSQNGTTVATYVTDNQFNGAFVFRNVAPGTYTLTADADGYIAGEPMEVTVTAANIAYPEVFLTSESYVPPTVEYFDYPDELAGTAFGARDEYSFAQHVTDQEIPELEGAKIRRMLQNGKYLYILGHKTTDTEEVPVIVVLDAATLATVAVPGIEGAEGTERNISDIAVTADGVLIASAKELCHFDAGQVREGETRGECFIYRWTNNGAGAPEGNPEPWVSTLLSGNFYRAYSGGTIAYKGTSEEGTVVLSAENANSGGKVFYSLINIAGGEKASDAIANASFFNHETCGAFTFNTVPADLNHIYVNSPALHTMQIHVAGKELIGQMPEGIIPMSATAPGYFRYSGHVYMVATDNPETTDAVTNTGLVLLDITSGIENATVVPTANTALESAVGTSAAAGMAVVRHDDYGEVSGADMALFLVRGNKVSRFTTEGVRQPQGRREFAYGINLEDNEGQYTVTFNATGDAPEANIILTNTDDDTDVVTIAAGAVAKGENSVSFSRADLDGATYTMAVAIQSKRIAEAGEYFADPAGVTKRGGVVSITDPDAASLGYTLVTIGANNGVKVYAPDGTVSGPFLAGDPRLSSSNQSSMFRGDQREGMAVFADWSDAGAGYWVVDPLNPSEMSQLLAGERSGNAGSYAYNGTIIGGGSSCVAFQGKGDNTKMFSFLEDYPTGNMPGGQNMVYRYDIGSDAQITRIPDQAYENMTGAKNLVNQNVEIATTPEGFFASQCRSAGNNLAGAASFYYVKNDGELAFASPVLDFINSSNSGIAVNAANNLLAVAQYDCITVMNMAWEDGEPVLTKLCDIPTAHVEWSHMRFDAGDNLHVYQRDADGYHAYSIPGETPVATVPAPSRFVVIGSNSGVEDITVEEAAQGEAVYYNLNGIRVNGELTPGVYVKVQGTTATKVVVR